MHYKCGNTLHTGVFYRELSKLTDKKRKIPVIETLKTETCKSSRGMVKVATIYRNTPPRAQWSQTLITSPLRKLECLGFESNLLITTSTILPVSTNNSLTVPLQTWSLGKCYFASICFDSSLTISSEAIFMAPWLSAQTLICRWPPTKNPKSAYSWSRQKVSRSAWLIVTYSASAVDCATRFCFLLLQDRLPLAFTNTYPLVDLRSSLSTAKYKSVKPWRLSPIFLYTTPMFHVPLK